MATLLGLLCFALLLVVLIRLGKSTGEIESLKHRVNLLENELKERKRAAESEAKPQSESVAPGVETPVLPGPAPETPLRSAETGASPIPERAVALEKTVPKAPPPEIRQPETVAARGSDIAGFLRRIGLWPPERKDGSSELVFMQWWAPRIGGALAILAIIFFAVYVAQGTPPWVKFAEMLAASLGVFSLGLYVSKKRPGLGNVLLATGLSMIYISSVAGYAVGPVKVVDNPLIGAFMQIAALVLNFGMGSWRKDRGILVLALVFGYISALFAALEGFREAALIASLLIYLAGLFSYRRIGGLTLASLSLAGVYLPLGGFIVIELFKAAPVYPLFWSVMVFLILTVSVLPACRIAIRDPEFLNARWNRWYQSLNTSLAIGLGFLFTAHFYPLAKTEFYGVLAITFIGWSLVWFRRDVRGIEFHLFFLKGSALASLWFINHFHGDLRWMALGLQVVILAASVHRSKSMGVEIITLLTWFVSFGYFIITDFNEPTWSFLWAMQGVYVLVSAGGLGYLMGYDPTERTYRRRIVYSLPALLLATAAGVFAVRSDLGGLDAPANLALMAFLMFLVALIPFVRTWIPVFAGGLVFVVAHAAFWIEASGLNTLFVVLVVTALCLFGLFRMKLPVHQLCETALHGLWVLTVSFYLESYSIQSWYPILVAVFALLLFLGGYSPLKRLPEVCAIPLVALLLFMPNGGHYPPLSLLLFAGIVGLTANLGILRPEWKGFIYYLRSGDLMWWLLNGLFLFCAGWALESALSMTNRQLVWVGLGAVYFTLWYWRNNWVSFVGALVFALLPVFSVFHLWFHPPAGGFIDGAPWSGQVLLVGLVAMALWLGMGAYSTLHSHTRLSAKGHTILAWVCGLLAFLVYATAFDYPLLNWERLYTPLLAAFSIGLIVLGIVLKSRPYRLVAMLAFLVPLVRLFAYDIRETLYRIVAFAVLAVILTLVGFLYQKFSARIG